MTSFYVGSQAKLNELIIQIRNNEICHTKPLKTFVATGSGEKTVGLLRQDDKSSDTDDEIPCGGKLTGIKDNIAVEEQSA